MDATVNESDSTLTDSTSGLSSFFGGLLSKAAETGLDIVKAKNTNQPGTVYPTGQTNPAQVQSAAVATPGMTLQTKLLIGGGALVVVVVLAIALRRK